MNQLGHVVWTTPYHEQQQRAATALKAFWNEKPRNQHRHYDGLAYLANGLIAHLYRYGRIYTIEYEDGTSEGAIKHEYRTAPTNQTIFSYYVDLMLTKAKGRLPAPLWAYVFVMPKDGVWINTETHTGLPIPLVEGKVLTNMKEAISQVNKNGPKETIIIDSFPQEVFEGEA